MHIRCSVDGDGIRRAETDPPIIGEYLEQDVQGSQRDIAEILQQISLVRSGQRGPWELTGNAHHLCIAKDKVTISNLWVDPQVSVEVDSDHLVAALIKWKEFLQTL